MPPFKTTALPPVGATFTVREVALHAGCTIRTVRHYIREKVVPAPEFRSARTRYDRAFLVRLRAAMTLRRRGLHVRGVLETLATTTAEEMSRLAGYDGPAEAPGAPAPATAGASQQQPVSAGVAARTLQPGGAQPEGAQPAPRTLPVGFLGRHRPGASPPHERWDSFELCPGVKLVVRAEPDPEAFRVVQEVLALFGPTG